ncbi:MAG TPA: DUF2726 domain-containing protein [Anaerolineae bacterium]|nr:DUF2726 domain-containing protein [Anaerolineae bacterium]
MTEPKQYLILRKILKTLGLSPERIDDLIALIQSWLTGETITPQTTLPYQLRDDFLSPAELNFYRVLQTAVADWAIIHPKINLGDLFYPHTGDASQNRIYRNKIDRKHVDFLLCDPHTIQPILGIELDDKSHQRPDRQERDAFVNAVFAAAKLPLARVAVRAAYPTDKLNQYLRHTANLNAPTSSDPLPNSPTANPSSEPIPNPPIPNPSSSTPPLCPKCNAPLLLRTAKSGTNKGNQFWGCSNYPQCRQTIPVSP